MANRDLIEKLYELEDRVEREARGSVEYNWVPRHENPLPHELCDDVLDNWELY